MKTTLTEEQEALLKRTRDTLGRLRDALSDTNTPESDREALIDSMSQLDELFLLVVAGEYNAGKSSFVNALVGQDLLTEGVTPTTSQIHVLKHGEETTSEPNGVGVWTQTAPVPILEKLSIVDTPGTNAINRDHEALTTEFIPRSDLVLFLTSADRPFTESERKFLTEIKNWGKKIVLIVNKADILDWQARIKVEEFVTDAAKNLIGSEIPAIFMVSAKLGQRAKHGEPELWDESGFGPLEDYIDNTLDDTGRFRLKLLNPLGVAHKLSAKQLDDIGVDLIALQDDGQLLDDIERQQVVHNEDMERNFEARLGEIDNLLLQMEKRGQDYFDETIRLSRIRDLLRSDTIKQEWNDKVVADTPQQIEVRVNEMIDWLVDQDLQRLSATSKHMSKRQQMYETRIIGDDGPREGTLAYDRQRLVDSIGKDTERAVATYNRSREAAQIADGLKSAVINSGLVSGAGIGLGAAILAATATAAVDITGVFAGLTLFSVGMFILPNRRRKASLELRDKMASLRKNLVRTLTEQFEKEKRRSNQRVDNVVAPFSKFVRAEQGKLNTRRETLSELEAHIEGLKSALSGE